MKHEEHNIQAAIIRWARYNEVNFPALKWLYAVPSGGHRHVAVAVKLKAEGVRRGIPDLFLPCPTQSRHGLYIEVKTEKGVLTPEQREFRQYALENKYEHTVVRSVDEFEKAIRIYLA